MIFASPLYRACSDTQREHHASKHKAKSLSCSFTGFAVDKNTNEHLLCSDSELHDKLAKQKAAGRNNAAKDNSFHLNICSVCLCVCASVFVFVYVCVCACGERVGMSPGDLGLPSCCVSVISRSLSTVIDE